MGDEIEDLNGECFLVGGSGVNVVGRPEYHVFYYNPGRIEGGKFDYESAKSLNAMFNFQLAQCLGWGLVGDAAVFVAVVRVLAWKGELLSRKPDHDRGKVKDEYQHCCRDAEEAVNQAQGFMKLHGRELASSEVVDNFRRTIKKGFLQSIRSRFNDIVCTVAYVFRARAHHYTPEVKEVYERVWKCTLHTELTVPWEQVATIGLHAVYPSILDEFWIRCAEKGECSGTLVKRVNCYAAGSACIAAVDVGFRDLVAAMPTVPSLHVEAAEELQRVKASLAEQRWGGSVNHNLYGSGKVVVDEAKLAGLAALILSLLQQIAPRAPLAQSRALQRLAGNAPLTGALAAGAVRNAADSDRMALAYLPVNQEKG